MIHWKIEGQHVYQGISIYHPKDEASAGAVLRIGDRFWLVRYSKIAKKWNFDYRKVDLSALRELEDRYSKM